MAESERMDWIRRWYGDKLADELKDLRGEIDALKCQTPTAPTPGPSAELVALLAALDALHPGDTEEAK